jgi:hypothetical protein
MPNSYNAQLDPDALSARGPGGPASDIDLVQPSDTADLALYCRALRVHVPIAVGEATLRVTPLAAGDDAETVTLRFAGAGTYHEPISVRRVWQTGTSPGIEIHGYTR